MVTQQEAREDFQRAFERARTGTPIDPRKEFQRAVTRTRRRRGGGGGSDGQTIQSQIDQKALADLESSRQRAEEQQIEQQLKTREASFSRTIAGQLEAKEKDKGFILSVEPVSKPTGFLEKTSQRLFEIEAPISQKTERGIDIGFKETAIGVGAGFAQRGVETLLFGKQFITQPIKTIKSIPSGLASSFEKIGKEFSRPSGLSPGFVGGIGFDLVFLKGTSKIGSGIGKVRGLKSQAKLKGATEIPFESITISEKFASSPLGTTAKQLQKQFREQRIVTAGGVDKIIKLPGEPAPGTGGVRVFTGTTAVGDVKEFAPFLGASREPGLFVSPQLSKEFLRLQAQTEPTLFGLGFSFKQPKTPTAFRIQFEDIGRIPSELISGVKEKGVTGFKGFASPELQKIISFRASELDPFKPAISTRFELAGGEIEAIARPGAVLKETSPVRFFTTFEGTKIPIREFKPTGAIVEPQDLIRRPRGTAIIETEKGIPLTFAPEEKAFVLPGGGIDFGESLLAGTIRETFEETGLSLPGLKAQRIGQVTGDIKRFGKGRKGKDPFRFVQEDFEVFKFQVGDVGTLTPSKEVQKIAFFQPGKPFKGDISPKTLEILELGGIKTGIKPPKQKPFTTTIKQKDLGGGQFTLSDISKISEEAFKPIKRPIITPSRSFLALSSIERQFGLFPGKEKGLFAPGIEKSFSFITPKSSEIIGGLTPSEQLTPFPPFTPPGIITPPTDFFEDPFLPTTPIIIRGSARRKPIKKIKKKKKGFKQLIRPSFTGIITSQGIRSPLVGIEFEEPAFITKIGRRDIGIIPSTLRGTRTGLAPPRRKATKKKTINKKSQSKDLFRRLTNF